MKYILSSQANLEENMMNRKERKHTNFCSENEEDKPKIELYIVGKCAEKTPQMVKWDTPNGKMGHPKWCFGV